MGNEPKFAGTWHNQYGSEMRLEVDSNGRVFGKFRTNVGRDETKELWTNSWFDVVGFVNGELISFIVNYHSTGTLSAVSGRLISKEKSQSGSLRIETQGFTSFNLSEKDQWRSTTITSAIYEPGPAQT